MNALRNFARSARRGPLREATTGPDGTRSGHKDESDKEEAGGCGDIREPVFSRDRSEESVAEPQLETPPEWASSELHRVAVVSTAGQGFLPPSPLPNLYHPSPALFSFAYPASYHHLGKMIRAYSTQPRSRCMLDMFEGRASPANASRCPVNAVLSSLSSAPASSTPHLTRVSPSPTPPAQPAHFSALHAIPAFAGYRPPVAVSASLALPAPIPSAPSSASSLTPTSSASLSSSAFSAFSSRQNPPRRFPTATFRDASSSSSIVFESDGEGERASESSDVRPPYPARSPIPRRRTTPPTTRASTPPRTLPHVDSQPRQISASPLTRGLCQSLTKAELVLAAHHASFKDWPTALRLYEHASFLGSDVGAYNLGVCYSRGFGVAQDKIIARDFFRKAAERGHVKAAYAYSLFSLTGRESSDPSSNEDHRLALAYLFRAADAGYPRAMLFAGGHLLFQQDRFRHLEEDGVKAAGKGEYYLKVIAKGADKKSKVDSGGRTAWAKTAGQAYYLLGVARAEGLDDRRPNQDEADIYFNKAKELGLN